MAKRKSSVPRKIELTELDKERNRLAKRLNQRTRVLMKNPELGTAGTVTAIDKQLSKIYNKPRSPMDGYTKLRAKERGGGATKEEVAALKSMLEWKSTTIKGVTQINRAANERFREWGWEGHELTASEIAAFFDSTYYKRLEAQFGSSQAVVMMTEIKRNPAKLKDLQDYLYAQHKRDFPDSKLTREQFLKSDAAKWQTRTIKYTDAFGNVRTKKRDKRNRKQRGISADLHELSLNFEQIFGSD